MSPLAAAVADFHKSAEHRSDHGGKAGMSRVITSGLERVETDRCWSAFACAGSSARPIARNDLHRSSGKSPGVTVTAPPV